MQIIESYLSHWFQLFWTYLEVPNFPISDRRLFRPHLGRAWVHSTAVSQPLKSDYLQSRKWMPCHRTLPTIQAANAQPISPDGNLAVTYFLLDCKSKSANFDQGPHSWLGKFWEWSKASKCNLRKLPTSLNSVQQKTSPTRAKRIFKIHSSPWGHMLPLQVRKHG